MDIYLTEEEVRWLSKYLLPRMTRYKGAPRGWNEKSDLNLKMGTGILEKLQKACSTFDVLNEVEEQDMKNADKLGF